MKSNEHYDILVRYAIVQFEYIFPKRLQPFRVHQMGSQVARIVSRGLLRNRSDRY